MGSSFYSSSNRNIRASSSGYYSKSIDDIFEQSKVRRIHESMNPSTARMREARDSENHPNSLPIIIGLDVTGSMGKIPHHLVKDGLPNMITGIINNGFPDPQILFLAIGDHIYDYYPLQVGQFESGDAELDMWLTRTYLESGGGGNRHESYLLAWYFAAFHTVTDNWEKRRKKGFIFTIGDENCHRELNSRTINDLMGIGAERGYNRQELLSLAQEKYHVFHIHLLDGSYGDNPVSDWKHLLGENCIVLRSYKDVDKTISNIVCSFDNETVEQEEPIADMEESDIEENNDIIL